MFNRDDTIVAIATPPGRGGIGVVRLSGPDASRIAGSLTVGATAFEPRRAAFARVRGAAGVLDHAVVTFFPAPGSYTGEDTVEISIHGSQVLLRSIVQASMGAGARLAEPGEFTLRAFLNERIDLVQAEAVRDLVDAVTPLQARAAFDQLDGTLTKRIGLVDAALLDLAARLEASLDFPEEGYHFVSQATAASELREVAEQIRVMLQDATRGRLIRDGVQVTILGRPNSGKSTLFNRLVGADRAIVTAIPGTTRDLVTERVEIEGLAVTLVDTAGLRDDAADAIELEGIARSRGAQQVADLVLVVLDGSEPLTCADHHLLGATAGRARVVVENKSDLPPARIDPAVSALRISAQAGEGLEGVRRAIVGALTAEDAHPRDVPAVTNVRHAALLARAHASLLRASDAVDAGTPEEFVALDVSEARAALEEITGARTPDDVLRVIFEKFCIGK
jgi:tRNA modification GTPase